MTSDQIKWSDIRGLMIDKCHYGTFHNYCFLISSCDDCDKRIRFLCKIKNKIEDLQVKIITKTLNSRPESNNGK